MLTTRLMNKPNHSNYSIPKMSRVSTFSTNVPELPGEKEVPAHVPILQQSVYLAPRWAVLLSMCNLASDFNWKATLPISAWCEDPLGVEGMPYGKCTGVEAAIIDHIYITSRVWVASTKHLSVKKPPWTPMKKLSRIYDSIFRKYATLGVPTGARRSISQNCWYAGSTSGKSVTGWENSFELDSSVKALPMVFS